MRLVSQRVVFTKKAGTRTSAFGVSRREGHDARVFYGRRLYPETPRNEERAEVENPIPPEVRDKV
ncbi:site-specific DNA-methyltransferase, partial [Candidatus Bathyarchaeota archaeon]|nr:site-specific DNA-methyltransferase [Candidatus Bathyarchaeota archaeon]